MRARRMLAALALLACASAAAATAAAATAAATPELGHFLDKARGIEDWLVSTRRLLHTIPELFYEEHNTSATIRRYLDDLGIPYQYPVAKTGVVGTIGSGSPIVALRADIDALPIHEETGFEYASRSPGRMHACGHDAHMTMLLGAARLLKGMEKELKGTVRLLFQPAEEGGAGGDLLVKEGALDGVKAAFGMHVWPMMPSGSVTSRPGTIMAGTIQFDVTVKGQGGHAAMPHLTKDPVVAGAAITGAIQTLVSRETSPFDSAVISVTRFTAGDAYNVVPDTVRLGGTMRGNTEESITHLRRRFEETVASTAAAHGCTAEVDWMEQRMPYYPPTVNDPEAFKFATDVASRLVPDASQVGETEGTMAGEDFAFIARAVPACFLFLGTRNESVGAVHGLHTPRFTLDEGVLPLGAALHTALATQYLEQWHARQQGGGSGTAAREELAGQSPERGAMLPAIKTDVCIVGGGPAGLSTAHAILRARPDARVAVMERSDLRPRGAWFGLPPNGVRAIEAIDPALRDRLAQHNTRHMVQRRYSAAGELVSSTEKGEGASRVLEFGDVYTLQWHVLQRELADALPQGVLQPRYRFLNYSESADGVNVQFEGPDGPAAVEAAVLVGCDGSQSLVREQMLGDGPPKYLGMAIWRAARPRPADWLVEHGSVSWGAPGQPSLMAATFDNGHLSWQGFVPWPAEQLHLIGGGRRAYISGDEDPAERAGREAKQTPEEAGAERQARALAAFKGHPQIVRDLIASTDPAAITEHGQFYREEADCQVYARGRVALVGDAAHLATPFLAQGCSQALEDALELGRAMGMHGVTPEALAAYQTVRLPQAGAVQRESVQLCKDFHSGNMARHEVDVNIDCGFVKRTHAPLVPANVAA